MTVSMIVSTQYAGCNAHVRTDSFCRLLTSLLVVSVNTHSPIHYLTHLLTHTHTLFLSLSLVSTSRIQDLFIDRGETHFIVGSAGSTSAKGAPVCLYVSGLADVHCAASPTSRTVVVPHTLSGIVTASYHRERETETERKPAKGFELEEETEAESLVLHTERYFVCPVPSSSSVQITGSVVTIQSPRYGTVASTDQSFSLQYSYNYDKVADSNANANAENGGGGADSLDFVAKGVMALSVEPNSNIITADRTSEIEPGSWFIYMQPRHGHGHGDSSSAVGYRSAGYIEYVLGASEIARHRRITTRAEKEEKLRPRSNQQKQKQASREGERVSVRERGRLHVCIWGSNHLDGQKNIWLQQAARMDRSAFAFTWCVLALGTTYLPTNQPR